MSKEHLDQHMYSFIRAVDESIHVVLGTAYDNQLFLSLFSLCAAIVYMEAFVLTTFVSPS